MDARDAEGLSFRCLEGCGFCCTTSPHVLDREVAALPRALVERRSDGTTGLRLKDVACGALDGARRCGVYAARPSACRAFPVHVHALDRLQVTLHRGCPGLGAEGDLAASLVSVGPEAAAALARARETWAEFRRRAESADLWDAPDDLRAAARALAPRLWTKRDLERLYAAVEDGDVAADELADAHEQAEPGVAARRLLADVADETFAGTLPQFVDQDLAWVHVDLTKDGLVRVARRRDGTRDVRPALKIGDLPLWRTTPEAKDVLAAALVRLAERDLAVGAAAKLVDMVGYEVTLAAAWGRVLADQAAGLTLRVALLAAWDGKTVADIAHARQAVAWQETAFLSLPTVGAVV